MLKAQSRMVFMVLYGTYTVPDYLLFPSRQLGSSNLSSYKKLDAKELFARSIWFLCRFLVKPKL